jgi:hypothetical protein
MSFFVVTPHLTIADRIIWFAWRVFMALSLLAVALMAGMAFAQEPGAPVVAAQPAWLTLVLGLAPWVIGGLVGLHLAHHLGLWLRADAAKRGGALGKLELVLADGADELDDYLTQNKQNVQDLVDPTKRAAAEAALKAAGISDAKAAVDSALKRALPVG